MNQIKTPKIIYIFLGLMAIACFISGYLFGIYSHPRFYKQLDGWYVLDACLGGCLLCDEKPSQPILEDLAPEEEPEEEALAKEILTTEASDETNNSDRSIDSLFYGKLAGFSVMENAINYLNILNKRGIAASIKTYRYTSSNKKKKRIREWYQVVTDPLPYKQTQKIVDSIIEEDRLHEASIAAYTNE